MWSFCSLRYIISYTCEVGSHERDGGRVGVAQTLACSQKQWWRSRKNPSECLLSREAACNNCWERRKRHEWYTPTHTLYIPTQYTYPHNIHTVTWNAYSALLQHFHHLAQSTVQESEIWCVCVCVHNAIIPYPEHFLFCGPSHVEQSPRASPTCTTQHARSAGNKTAPLLPSVSPCMGYQLSTSLVSEV